jgi:hypothetical protein
MIKVSKQAAANVAHQRPDGYLDRLSDLAARQDDSHYYFTVEAYARLYEEYRGQEYQSKHLQVLERESQKLPRLVAWLTRFRKPEDRGLGDTLERLLAAAGGRRFKRIMHLLHLPCGCEDRQRWLNERFPNN